MDDEIFLAEEQEIDRLTNRLSEALLESEEYKRYQAAQDAIRQDLELYNRVNELRRHNYYLQNSRYGRMSNEEFMDISGKSRSLRENPLVGEFLNAEIDFARKIQEIMQKIIQNIDFDIDFL